MGPGPERPDSFEGVCLDDEFVRSAPVHEPTAAERAHYRVPEAATHRRPGGRAGRRGRRQRRFERFRQCLPWAGHPPRLVIVIVGLVLAAVTVSWLRSPPPAEEVPTGPTTADLLRYREGGIRLPPPADDRRDHPLGTPPRVPAEHGTYQFIRHQKGSERPVAWDPCRPIHVVVNTRTAPPDGEALLQEAVAAVARATGLRIEVDGTTTERLGLHRRPVQADRYGNRWAPVLVAWTDQAQIPALAYDVVGVGGSRALPLPSGDRVYVTGAVALDGPQLATLRDGFDGGAKVRAAIEHELGHVVGLAHVEDSTELMSSNMHAGIDSFAAGDRAGLARLGAGQCYANG